jgi:hypothetical protein
MNSAAMILRFATPGKDFQRSPSTFSEAGKRSALPGTKKSVYNLRRISNKTIEIKVSFWFLKKLEISPTKVDPDRGAGMPENSKSFLNENIIPNKLTLRDKTNQ